MNSRRKVLQTVVALPAVAAAMSFAVVAALFPVESAKVISFVGYVGQVGAQEQESDDDGLLSDRLVEARKAVEHAEQRLKHAQLIGEGLQAAKTALVTAKQELQAAELEVKSTADDQRQSD